MSKVLLLDNYDSFTYNLYDYVSSLGYEVIVMRNDVLDLKKLNEFTHIILSPGPGLPNDSGCMKQLILEQVGKKPILGVCLGMQALALHFGDELYNLENVRHGRQLNCSKIDRSVLLQNVPKQFQVGLYHSWAVSIKNEYLKITSRSEEGVIMSIENEKLGCFGVQFHPESIMTPDGKVILRNFMRFSL